MAHGYEELDTEARLTRLETKMDALTGNGQPGAIHELRRWIIISVILSALALGSRALDIAGALIKH